MSVLTAAENSFRAIEVIHTHTKRSFTRYSDVGAFTVAEQSNLALMERELRLPYAIFSHDKILVVFTPASTRTTLLFPSWGLH